MTRYCFCRTRKTAGLSRDAGFTLLEMLVAVAVLALLAGVVPRSFVFARSILDHSRDWVAARLVAEAVLNDTAITHWFAVQVDAVHPKLTAVPLGVDRRDVTTLDAAPRVPWAQREIRLHAHFTAHTPERRALRDQLAAEPWGHPPMAKVPPPAYFAELGRSQFVVSPPGLGWDCYRTYEALAMGAIPIVRRQDPISAVVDGLPVVVVEDWADLTPDRLESEAARRVTAPEWSRLTLAYWTQQVQLVRQAPAAAVSHAVGVKPGG